MEQVFGYFGLVQKIVLLLSNVAFIVYANNLDNRFKEGKMWLPRAQSRSNGGTD